MPRDALIDSSQHQNGVSCTALPCCSGASKRTPHFLLLASPSISLCVPPLLPSAPTAQLISCAVSGDHGQRD